MKGQSVAKTIITYGTFDMFHIGHLRLLKRLKSMAERVIVGVSTDEFNRLKGKKTLIPFRDRKEIVESVRYVDLVIDEKSWEQKVDDIRRYEVDIFAIGDDWEGKFDYLREYCQVRYLPRTSDVSTTRLKKSLSELQGISEKDISTALEVLNILYKDFQ